MQDFIAWLASSGFADFMRTWRWAWPLSEIFHFVGMSVLFGSVLVMDMRLLGFFRRQISLQAVHSLTPWAILGFTLNLLSGCAFLIRDAANYVDNAAFQFKMACVLLAGINLLIFWVFIRKPIERMPADADVGAGTKLVGIVSLCAWIGVIWGGRLISVFGNG